MKQTMNDSEEEENMPLSLLAKIYRPGKESINAKTGNYFRFD
jgi:hypothetical protein